MNHSDLASQYEELYCNVIDLSHVGFGCPDLLIALSGRCFLREVKTDRGQMNAAQKTFAETWRGPKIEVMRSRADVVNDVLNIREKISRGLR